MNPPASNFPGTCLGDGRQKSFLSGIEDSPQRAAGSFNWAVIHDPEKGQWLQFLHPRTVLTAANLTDILPLLAEVERILNRGGLYAAGWIGYEAAGAFDPAFRVHTATVFPLACFGIFAPPTILKSLPTVAGESSCRDSWQATVNRNEHAAAVARIKDHIASGDTYQVNYTLRERRMFREEPWRFFLETCTDAPYAAFIDTDAYCLCSASPELFFSLDGGRIHSKPMKGTAARGKTPAEDRANARWLYRSEKNRAENVMIVDMIRNDLGRIARTGSVRVPRLYAVEKYPSIWQMTSTVEARTAASLPDIFRALFPCASITGAPKVKTMEIIAALETTPRNIYTGAIGLVAPGRVARFNVAIRTTLIDKTAFRAEYGVGGGIVWDSTADEEYGECLTKAKIILTHVSPPPFQLLETMLWTPDRGYFLLSRHLARLRGSARHFAYRYDERLIDAALYEATGRLAPGPHRVRLRLSRDGAAECDSAPQEPSSDRPFLVRLSLYPVDTLNPFVLHKTTRRGHYEAARAPFPDADDVILYNGAKEVTESCIANVVILRNGRLVTPPLGCGLLRGIYRAELLEQGEIVEEKVTIPELKQAEKIFLINSVRRWQEAVLAPEDRL
jgi:para-aminobenzoate synthetase / 4-amino-4-deoxychorismate lyase